MRPRPASPFGPARRALSPLAAGALAAGVFLLGPGSGAAGAEAPSQAGWWTQANPGGVAGAAPAPAPPDVPSGGLLVEGGASSVSGGADTAGTAYGAVVYLLAPGQRPAALTLDVAPGSATTPAAALELCPLSSSAINAEQGGPMSDAPGFSCSTNVVAQPSAAGDSYSFDLSKLGGSRTLALAVLATTATDRVVLAKPAAASLAVGPSGATPAPAQSTTGSDGGAAPAGNGAPGDGPAPAAADPSAPAALADPAASLSPALSGSLPAASAPELAQAAGGSRPAASVAPTSPAAAPVPSSPAGTGGARPAAVAALVLAFLIGGAIWLGAGRAAARAAARGAGS
jgi:S-DNA-T family DNA segregation ATPase FtsK/SpoIIIE